MEQLLAHLWGDYLLQSDWMASNKRKDAWACWCHAATYTLCFVPLVWSHQHPWSILNVVFSTHWIIDQFGLARYVVWAKNHIGPKGWCYSEWLGQEQRSVPRLYWPWRYCSDFGFTPDRNKMPAFLAATLLIVADNTLHLTCNYIALRWL